MIITKQEDGGLVVYASVKDAVKDVEALDVEETFLAVFDEKAHPYVILWHRPNQRRIGVSANGEYTLVPSGPPDPEALLATIRAAAFIAPESAAEAVKELADGFARLGLRKGPP